MTVGRGVEINLFVYLLSNFRANSEDI